MLLFSSQNNIMQQAGVTLLEVVIALFVLSLGLLGIIQIQALSLRQTHESHLNTVAIFQAQNLLEQFRLWQVLPNSSGAETLLLAWNEKNQQLLPHGEGDISLKNNQLIIDMFWQDVTLHSNTPCLWFPTEKRMCLRWVGAYEN